jgi:cell division protein ZapE
MNTLESWYITQTKSSQLRHDSHQLVILQQLDQFINSFNNANGFFAKIFGSTTTKLGVYLYGEVGRGKTMIINKMYQQIKEKHKLRIHFHEFMQDIHQQLAKLKDQEEPISVIARNFRQKYRIIFLDEMHVSDIATAMILKSLFNSLFQQDIYLVTSSNYAPSQLYPDGLMRERFLPAIEIIKQKLTILSLNSQNDYRLLYNSHNKMFMINEVDNQDRLDEMFNYIANSYPVKVNDSIVIQSRAIPFVRQSQHIIWFDFAVICGDMRSQLDYLELSNKFEYIIIENISTISPQDKDIARRFTWLIDILYDNRRKLIMSANCELSKIYQSGDFAIEFKRTVSRLTEMQTTEYLTRTGSSH